jgi:hypothetical protein
MLDQITKKINSIEAFSIKTEKEAQNWKSKYDNLYIQYRDKKNKYRHNC